MQRLANLRFLILSDKVYGDNPVTRLPNYFLYAINVLKQVKKLD